MNIIANKKDLSDKVNSTNIIEKAECQTGNQVVAPVISFRRVDNDYNNLCSSWQSELPDAHHTGGMKGKIKYMIKKISINLCGWMIKPIIRRQSEFNLSVVHLLNDILKSIEYNDMTIQHSAKKPVVIVCRDAIQKSSRLQEVLMIFQYYRLWINGNCSLIFLHQCIEDNLYFELLQRTIYELQIKNVQFALSDDTNVINDYLSKTSIVLSLDENSKTADADVTLLQYAPHLQQPDNNAVLFDELDVKEIAELIEKCR